MSVGTLVRAATRRAWWEAGTALLEHARYSRLAPVWEVLYQLLLLVRPRGAVRVARGAAPEGGDLVIAVAGSAALAGEVAAAFGAAAPSDGPPGPPRPDGSLAEAAGPDLEVVRVHPWRAARWARAGWRVVPRRVRFELDLAGRWPPHAGRRSRSLANELRRVSRSGFAFEEEPARAALPDFRARMVAPYALERFGRGASLRVGRVARRGTILFAVRDGVRVGGGLLIPRGDRLFFPRLGVLAGRGDLVHEGLHGALYLAAIEWARARGFRVLDAGVASGFARGGIHRWKRKWGFVPRDAPLSDLLALRARTDAGRRALESLGSLDGGGPPK